MMTNDARLEIRIPSEVIDRLDRLAQRMSEETGLGVKSASVARKLILDGLAVEEKKRRVRK